MALGPIPKTSPEYHFAVSQSGTPSNGHRQRSGGSSSEAKESMTRSMGMRQSPSELHKTTIGSQWMALVACLTVHGWGVGEVSVW